MKKILIALTAAFVSMTAFSQNLTDAQKAAAAAAKAMEEAPAAAPEVKKPKYWTESLKATINAGHTSLTNWAAGGDNTMTLQAYIDANANYKKGEMFWNNRLQMDYGFLYASSKPILQKNTDRIYLESKWGMKTLEMKNLYFSANYDFKSQFSTGYNYKTPKLPAEDLDGNPYPEGTKLDEISIKHQKLLWKEARQLKSGLLAPAYTNLALGIDYKPVKWLSVNFAPLTGGFVIVRMDELRKNYGMELKKEYQRLDNMFKGVTADAEDPANPANPSNSKHSQYKDWKESLADGSAYKSAKFEFGAQLKVDAKVNVNNNFSYSTQVVLFSNYLDKPQNMRVNWDNRFDWKLAKYFSLTLITNLIYDDDIMIYSDKDGLTHQRVQFKESLAFGFTWTIASK